MSFFGVFFAGLSLFAKGVSKGQDTYTDYKSKQRSKQIGQNFYFDSKGICHDSETGRAITYHTDPFTGHRLIQDAYTLNTIRDLTAEERFDEINKAKERAKSERNKYYEFGRSNKVLDKATQSMYSWDARGTLYEEGKENFNSRECYYDLKNMHYSDYGTRYGYEIVYKNLSSPKDISKYVKETYDDITVYTDLSNGMISDISDEMKSKLEKRKIKWEAFRDTINREKNICKNRFGYIPLSK